MESKIIYDNKYCHNLGKNILKEDLLSKKTKFSKSKIKLNKSLNNENQNKSNEESVMKIHAKKFLKRKCLTSNNEDIYRNGKSNKFKCNFCTNKLNKTLINKEYTDTNDEEISNSYEDINEIPTSFNHMIDKENEKTNMNNLNHKVNKNIYEDNTSIKIKNLVSDNNYINILKINKEINFEVFSNKKADLLHTDNDNYKKILEKQLEQIERLKILNVKLTEQISKLKNEREDLEKQKSQEIKKTQNQDLINELSCLKMKLKNLKELNKDITNKYIRVQSDKMEKFIDNKPYLQITNQINHFYFNENTLKINRENKNIINVDEFLIEELDEGKNNSCEESNKNIHDLEERLKCILCNMEKDCIFLECGHIPYCVTCKNKMKGEDEKCSTRRTKQKELKTLKCPICHKENSNFLKVFF